MAKLKLTKDEFVDRAKAVHGDKYDYSLVNYVNCTTKVKIICPIHGVFEQKPAAHLFGYGCQQCGKENARLSRTSTLEQFINAARKVHGDKYDYSLVEYINNHTLVKIICPIHGVFEQRPSAHLKGNGCKQCGRKKATKSNTKSLEQFIENARKVHGDKYDYSLVNYINNKTKVKIICPIHGIFEQKPNGHITQKQGCPVCAGSLKYTKETFIEAARKVHGNRYDYSKVNYVNNKTPVIIICPIHGEFKQTPHKHLMGQGCFECFGKRRHTTEQFIEAARKIHGDKYDYSLVEYIDAYTPVTIICPKHGEFKQRPNVHLNGSGCPSCVELQNSKLEQLMAEFLTQNNIPFRRQDKYVWLKDKKQLKLDFYLPDYNIAIECHGEQHFKKHQLYKTKLETIQRRDEIKYKQCKEHGIDILYFAFKNYDENYKLGHIYTDLNELLQEILKYKNS